MLALTRLGHVPHVNPLLLGHEPEKREDDEAGEHGGAGVDAADDQGVLVHVVVVLVVGAQRHDGAQAEAVGEEDLGGGVNPHSRLRRWYYLAAPQRAHGTRYLGQLGEVGHEIEVDAVRGPLQGHAAEEEDRQQEVGEEGGEVDNLQ